MMDFARSRVVCVTGMVGDLWALNDPGTVAHQPSRLTKIKLAQDIEGSV